MSDIPKEYKANYIGAPRCFALERACREVSDCFNASCYLVGSSIERKTWRDVDIRMILSDEDFQQVFPDAEGRCHWEFDPRWLLFNTLISDWMSKVTNLPIDFQIQPQTWANEKHNKPRHAIGMRVRRARPQAKEKT